jgi:hypothetical protein
MSFNLTSDTFGEDEDIFNRLKEISLAAVSQDDAVQGEIVARKGMQARNQLIEDLCEKIASAMQPLGSYPGSVFSSALDSPEDILATLTNKDVLRETWVVYTVYAIFEEGEARLRFKFEDAGEVISKMLDRWERKCKRLFDRGWKRAAFDLNGDGVLTYLERGFSNTLSSVRVTA